MMHGQVDHEEDRTLLAAIAIGDRGAFQQFYSRHAGRVLGYVRQLTRNPALAEDITQEAFVAVWLKAASYQADRGDPAGWLFTITRNKLVDKWRRGDRDAETDGAPILAGLADPPNPIDVRVSLRQAMSHLTDDQRRMLEMAYYGGLTYEETADALRVPVGTLKSRMRAALGQLRVILEGST
ncbi:MAG: sigma-70 family RNA polymerase sigma factor [Acidobacteria bacterium]|nr:sigma-70 family RNA polymerase sigma factor [Acidobacteriota bacterium]